MTTYTKPQLKRLEKVDPQEYKILCFLRNRRKRLFGRDFRFVVSVYNDRITCKELVDNSIKNK